MSKDWQRAVGRKGRRVAMPLAELVEDMAIYPRHAVDPSNVASIAASMEAGIAMPPIVADEKSKRITDGWHRARAYKRVVGAEAVVDVDLVRYKDEAEMIADSVFRNASHGRKLDRIDRTRSVNMLSKHGLTVVTIAGLMNTTQDVVKRSMLKVAKTSSADPRAIPGTRKVALKRCVTHLEGTELSESQTKVHASLPGTSFLLVARQLADALQEGMVDLEDEKLVDELVRLYELLGEAVTVAG